MASVIFRSRNPNFTLNQNRSHFDRSKPLRNPNFINRLRTVPKSSSPQKNANNQTEKVKNPIEPIKNPRKPSETNPVSRILLQFRVSEFKLDDLGLEIFSIALPAALALAADPIASLVDSAFVGHVGSVELAAVGVSLSVFNLVSKLFNVPLLNITTSFVAEEQAMARENNNNSTGNKGFDSMPMLQESMSNGKKFFPAVSTSLGLAAGLGVAETVALSTGSGSLMNIMGIPVDSAMRLPAEHFLTLRALGAPAVVIALAAQGAFRGFMDTKTPLFATVIGNLLNAILDPVLIFFFGLGIGGAAVSTVISEYLIASILIWELNSKVVLVSPKVIGKGISRYLKSGGLLIGRTVAVLFTMTLATSMAARQGPIAMAGHQICLEVWLAVSLLTDALALAGQTFGADMPEMKTYTTTLSASSSSTGASGVNLFRQKRRPCFPFVVCLWWALLASGYSQGNYTRAQDVIDKVLQIGLATGTALALILFLGFETFSRVFSTDTAVLEIAKSGILFVAGSQPMNALAFVIDGLYYGVSDFSYAAYSMLFVGLITSLFMVVAVPVFGLAGVWMGLFLFMTLRVVAGLWRLSSRSGPWEKIWSDTDQVMTE